MDIEEIIIAICQALNKIKQEYFILKTANATEHGIVRERVFCYELYH